PKIATHAQRSTPMKEETNAKGRDSKTAHPTKNSNTEIQNTENQFESIQDAPAPKTGFQKFFHNLTRPSYAPTQKAQDALKSASKITPQYILFTPPNPSPPQHGLVFFGGAKVQEEAYAPIAQALAQRGIAVAIVRSPFDAPLLLPFSTRRVDASVEALQKTNPHIKLHLGGHSAGGYFASRWSDEQFKSIILLNAYSPEETSNREKPGMAIFGGQDPLIKPEKIEITREAFSNPQFQMIHIPDLNHAYGGDLWGVQEGDGQSETSTDELIRKVVDLIHNNLEQTPSKE
ncbi:MAG: alpha/beta hydrolase, partial [Myxococcota bacterium]